MTILLRFLNWELSPLLQQHKPSFYWYLVNIPTFGSLCLSSMFTLAIILDIATKQATKDLRHD